MSRATHSAKRSHNARGASTDTEVLQWAFVVAVLVTMALTNDSKAARIVAWFCAAGVAASLPISRIRHHGKQRRTQQ